MYNMNMVVMYTITKIQLLTRKCKGRNFEYMLKRGTQKEANNQTGQYQVFWSSKAYVSKGKLAKY